MFSTWNRSDSSMLILSAKHMTQINPLNRFEWQPKPQKQKRTDKNLKLDVHRCLLLDYNKILKYVY